MRPWDVFGIQLRFIGPASWVAVLQLLPPLTDEMKPASSWHVEAVQDEVG
ncbi:hypothetical protein [Rugosimonospora africana]|uniref:Uncharacterized protein n=1 Tax=Rugosimonospora africana TaxID=556532 RepID=A0A8J3QZR8_9ACTN|nr:hypothetical protein [Rugosimonospora africana]GIH19591.1 hypothetical protein Raf01_77630 [Rugosimonospora africana]